MSKLKHNSFKLLFGELIGTFVLVFIGIGSVAFAVLYDALNLYQIATIWTIAVTLGIYASKSLSRAHLNPAVTLAFLVIKGLKNKEVLPYIIGQFIGSVLAGILIYLIFSGDIAVFEASNNIIRGAGDAQASAMIFGEYYPNPANSELKELSTTYAMLLEGGGTFVLMLTILILVNSKRMIEKLIPVSIGLTVGILIVFIAPYTQAGFNPFRDFGPRLVSYYFGWTKTAFSLPDNGFWMAYVISPIFGASLAAVMYSKLIKSKR
jgi:glycerol uptake facilitator protein